MCVCVYENLTDFKRKKIEMLLDSISIKKCFKNWKNNKTLYFL